jgi:lipid-A-disaccharide synthase
MKHNRPDLLILIDYPGFNISIARIAKRCGVPVLYYISPQVWAWRQSRVKKIAKRVDRMAVILPFEEAFYHERGILVDYVGHPILDSIPIDVDRKTILRDSGLQDTHPIIGLLPGSRSEEVKNLLPLMVEGIELLLPHYPNIQCILPLASTIPQDLIQSEIKESPLSLKVTRANIQHVLSVCDLALVASGTATLETAVMEVPMIIIYKVSPISYWIGKKVVKVPHVGLPNLVAGKAIVPELIQGDVTPDRIASETHTILDDVQRRNQMKDQLRITKKKLGTGGASEKVARIAMGMMQK